MNERQRRFAEFYAANPNATEAAKLAGYSARTAYSIGQRLLKNVTPAAAQRAFLGKTSGSEADAARARMLNRMGIRGGESSNAEESRERMIQRGKKRGVLDLATMLDKN